MRELYFYCARESKTGVWSFCPDAMFVIWGTKYFYTMPWPRASRYHHIYKTQPQKDQKLISMNPEQRVGDSRDSSLPLANRTVPVSMLTVLQQMAMGHMQMKQMPPKYLDQACHSCKILHAKCCLTQMDYRRTSSETEWCGIPCHENYAGYVDNLVAVEIKWN